MHVPIGGGIVATAVLLGITHGLEPDHVAGITTLTQDADDPKLSALVGGLFGAGHAVLVLAWIAIAYLLFDRTSFPPMYEQLGLLLAGTVLAVLSLSIGLSGVRRLIHRHHHDHDGSRHSHFHVHLPLVTVGGEHGHRHGRWEYLKIGVIGALFTLSPPVSMLAFISVTLAEASPSLITSIVAGYTISIVATLALIGGGAGMVVKVTRDRGDRVHAAFQVVVSALVLVVALRLLLQSVPVLSTAI